MVVATIEILAFLGLFLFGMLYLEEQIKAASGRSFKRMLNYATNTNTRSIGLGFFTTALFQSSSVVSLMTLSFIGAGTMSLQNGIGIIFGSNLGTTATSWIIAVVGFKMNITLFAYSVIALGGIGSIFVHNQTRLKSIFSIFVGIGLIFLGLEGMKENFGLIANDFDLGEFTQINRYLFLLLGLALTAVIQSSSASIALAQSALFSQLISFEMAAFFVIGANIGTTVTILLGAIGGSSDKKRAAFVHLLFNVSTALIAVVIFVPLQWITFEVLPQHETIIALALFHTLFNLLGVMVWVFWIPSLARYVQTKFTKEPECVTKYIHTASPNVPIVALENLEYEIVYLSKKVNEFALFAINIVPPKALEKHISIDKLLDRDNIPLDVSFVKLYHHLQELEGEVLDYSSQLSLYITLKEQEQLTRLTNIASHLASASKAIKDMLDDFEVLSELEISDAQHFLHNIRYQILNSVLIFNDYLHEKEDNLLKMKRNYEKINSAYKSTLNSIASIAQNPGLSKRITTIAINDVHLTRAFSKNLYHALLGFDEKLSNGNNQLEEVIA